jgi:hypothetical protein
MEGEEMQSQLVQRSVTITKDRGLDVLENVLGVTLFENKQASWPFLYSNQLGVAENYFRVQA